MSMDARLLGVLVLVVFGGVAGCVGDDSGSDEPAEIPNDQPDATDTPEPTATPTATPTASPTPTDTSVTATPSSSGGTLTDTPEPIQAGGMELVIGEITECGITCRDADLELENKAGEARTNVELDLQLEADGEVVWSDVVTVGDLAQGQSTTKSIRVELDQDGAEKVGNNDWQATLVAEINSDQDSATAREVMQF